MREVLIQSYQPEPSGPVYGRVSDPAEFMKSQEYAHEHIETVVKDLLMKSAGAARVSGFGYTLTSFLTLTIGPGHVYDANGRLYDTLPLDASVTVAFAAAHQTLPRIDLVYALIEFDVDAETAFRPYTRLRTQSELEAGVPPYTPEQFNQPTERHDRATIMVRTGTANASPVAPAAGAGEVPLYHVQVLAGRTYLTAPDITSVRNLARSLEEAWAQIDNLNNSPAITALNEAIDDRFANLFSVAPNTGLSGAYNDAGNSYALMGVAATSSGMGMMPAADKSKLDAATHNNTASALVRRDGSGDFAAHSIALSGDLVVSDAIVKATRGAEVASIAGSNAANFQAQSSAVDVTTLAGIAQVNGDGLTGKGVYGRGHLYNGNTPVAYGGYFEATVRNTVNTTAGQLFGVRGVANGSVQAGSNLSTFGVYGEASSNHGAARAGYFAGDVVITGNLSKGSGTFLIDHPLDPQNKDLIHGFVESSRHVVFYPFSVTMNEAEAEVKLDMALGFTLGTFNALCQRAKVYSLFSNVTTGKLTATAIANGSFTIYSDNPADTGEVLIIVCAERKDPYVLTLDYVDGNGRLVPERNKPAPTVAEQALLNPVTYTVFAEESAPDEVRTEVVPRLIGKQGHPYHPAAVGGSYPTRQVTIVTTNEE